MYQNIFAMKINSSVEGIKTSRNVYLPMYSSATYEVVYSINYAYLKLKLQFGTSLLPGNQNIYTKIKD